MAREDPLQSLVDSALGETQGLLVHKGVGLSSWKDVEGPIESATVVVSKVCFMGVRQNTAPLVNIPKWTECSWLEYAHPLLVIFGID